MRDTLLSNWKNILHLMDLCLFADTTWVFMRKIVHTAAIIPLLEDPLSRKAKERNPYDNHM